jgi:hypothetical protein
MAGKPKRLPKTREEREFDQLMRQRKPSVWEDKGAVGDGDFRSLKGAAKHRQEENSMRPLRLPALAAGEGGEAAGAHGSRDQTDPAQRAPQKHRYGGSRSACVCFCQLEPVPVLLLKHRYRSPLLLVPELYCYSSHTSAVGRQTSALTAYVLAGLSTLMGS